MTDKKRLEEAKLMAEMLRVETRLPHDFPFDLVDWLVEQAERVQELESFIDRFINSLSNNCLKEHVRKYRTDKKLMRTIRRQNEPPSYLSTSDKFALISLTKLFENVAEQNKRYREALEFYAEESNYDYDVKVDVKVDGIGDDWTYKRIYTVGSKILDDGGEKARKALEG